VARASKPYGIYVYHVPILYFGGIFIAMVVPTDIRVSSWFGYVAIAALWVLSYRVARWSYNSFESYFLKWKDKFAARYVKGIEGLDRLKAEIDMPSPLNGSSLTPVR
jgi:hypothetical protein